MSNLPLFFVRRFAAALFVLTFVFSISVSAQTSTFTYQGRLSNNGQPANGTFNMVFELFAASSGGAVLASEAKPSVLVTDGVFTVQLDFGASVFTGMTRYLQITVNGTPLMPRHEITSPPYSIRSIFSSAADALSNLCSSCVGDSMIDDLLTITGGSINGVNIGASTPGSGIFTNLSGNSGIFSSLSATSTVSFPNNSITDAMVSNTLTASDLVSGTSVVSDAEVDNNLTLIGGTINNTVIGGTTPAAGTFTNFSATGTISLPNNSITDLMIADALTASDLVSATSVISDAEVDNNLTITGGIINGSIIGGTTPAAGNFTTLSAANSVSFPGNSITDAMVSNTLTASDIVSAAPVVSDAEVDDNLTVSGGTINNSVIGGTTPAAGTFTDLKTNGNLFTLDADNAAAGANVSIVAEQGSEPNGEIRYNATTNQWEISNNGGAFAPVAGAVNSFGTVVAGGQNLVSDSPTDSLTLSATGTNIAVSGDAGTDTASIDINESALAGNGLAATGDALAVNTGNGIQVSSDAVSLGNLTGNWSQNGIFDILLNNASSELRILGSNGAFFGTFDVGILPSDQTYTFSGAGGTVWTSGNDGTASALDADFLDGLNSTQFVRNDQPTTISGAVANLANSTTGATPSVGNLTVLSLNYASATIITNLTDGVPGQCVVLMAQNANPDINDAGSFKLSANWTPDADDTLTVCSIGGSWVETARSNN